MALLRHRHSFALLWLESLLKLELDLQLIVLKYKLLYLQVGCLQLVVVGLLLEFEQRYFLGLLLDNLLESLNFRIGIFVRHCVL